MTRARRWNVPSLLRALLDELLPLAVIRAVIKLPAELVFELSSLAAPSFAAVRLSLIVVQLGLGLDLALLPLSLLGAFDLYFRLFQGLLLAV